MRADPYFGLENSVGAGGNGVSRKDGVGGDKLWQLPLLWWNAITLSMKMTARPQGLQSLFAVLLTVTALSSPLVPSAHAETKVSENPLPEIARAILKQTTCTLIAQAKAHYQETKLTPEMVQPNGLISIPQPDGFVTIMLVDRPVKYASKLLGVSKSKVKDFSYFYLVSDERIVEVELALSEKAVPNSEKESWRFQGSNLDARALQSKTVLRLEEASFKSAVEVRLRSAGNNYELKCKP